MPRLISVGAASLTLLAACSLLPTGSSPTATPAATPVSTSVAPTATRAPASATPTAPPPKPTNTPESEAASTSGAATVWVGNTDGEGVYIRKTPVMDDRIRAYPDGTELTIIGDDVDSDGQHWRNVRTPDGLEGYVPSMYTTDTPP
jgi:hypothetical protein